VLKKQWQECQEQRRWQVSLALTLPSDGSNKVFIADNHLYVAAEWWLRDLDCICH